MKEPPFPFSFELNYYGGPGHYTAPWKVSGFSHDGVSVEIHSVNGNCKGAGVGVLLCCLSDSALPEVKRVFVAA